MDRSDDGNSYLIPGSIIGKNDIISNFGSNIFMFNLAETPESLLLNFELTEVISIGPQSITWKIKCKPTGEDYALKIIKK